MCVPLFGQAQTWIRSRLMSMGAVQAIRPMLVLVVCFVITCVIGELGLWALLAFGINL